MPLRILHISTRLILGGSQENTILSCEGQARLGHKVHLAYGPIYGPEGSLLERVQRFNAAAGSGEAGSGEAGSGEAGSGEAKQKITTHEVPDLVREVSPLSDLRAYWQLRKLIRELKPDVVHTHSSKAGVLGRFAAWDEFAAHGRATSVPAQDDHVWQCRIVHTIHGPPFMPVDPREPPITRLKRRVNNAIYMLAERAAAKRCHVIVSVADAMTREFLRRGIGTPEQYVTVYSGMETARFLHADAVTDAEPVADIASAGNTSAASQDRASIRTALGLRDDDFVVGTVARLAEHKGHDDVLDALHEMLRRDERVKLLWVGDGWWRDRLLDRARVLGVRVGKGGGGVGSGLSSNSNQIITTGLVPPERVPGLIRAMDVLVHPSYREGLPRTVPQAQLCGVAPIAYDCDGTSEAIVSQAPGGTPRESSTGILVPTGDIAALRKAVEWAMTHPSERAAMAARGRVAAAERFDADAMVQALERVYRG